MALEKLGSTLDTSRYLQHHQEVNRYVSTPEQLQALRLCDQLDDRAHKAIYLALCKRTRPELIEAALRFVTDAQARDKGRLFSWKVKQLRAEWRQAGKNPDRPFPVTAPPRRRTTRPTAGQQTTLFDV